MTKHNRIVLSLCGGIGILLLKPQLFSAWLIPGLPPPGPFG